MALLEGITSGTASSSTGSNTASQEAAASLEDDLNQFLTLLVTQLQNQDPLDPMDSNEFTSQLVQFASVEQQIYQNSNLEQLVALQETNQVSSMVDFIDKTVEVDGQSFTLENGQAEFSYTMPAGAASASIIIRDSSGITVYEQDADTTAGRHDFTWDGTNAQGEAVSDGQYSVLVTGLDQTGELLQITQTVFGRVTGVGLSNGETSLFLGDLEVPQAQVLSVKETPTTTTTE